MTENNVTVLAVKTGEEFTGLVTVSDVMFSLSRGDSLKETKISSFLTKCVGKEMNWPLGITQ